MRMAWICVTMLLTAATASAQDANRPEDYHRLYNDTLAQLHQDHNRLSEVAADNQRLNARIAELEKQISARDGQITDLKIQVAAFDDRTFFLRSFYSAWQAFIAQHESVRREWDLFINVVTPDDSQPRTFFDPEWPLSGPGE